MQSFQRSVILGQADDLLNKLVLLVKRLKTGSIPLSTFTEAFHIIVLLQYLKADKTNRKENNSADSQSDSQSSVSDSPSAGPPPFHRSQEFPRRPLEPFHLHSFPKVQKNPIYFYPNTWPSINKAHMILL